MSQSINGGIPITDGENISYVFFSKGFNTSSTDKLNTPRKITINLNSGSYDQKFDGSKDIDLGIQGILPVSKGGTGNNSGYIQTGAKSGSTIGNSATIEGYNNTVTGNYSHAEGYGNITAGDYQSVIGRYNTSSSSTSNKFIVGKGTSSNTRANCFRATDLGCFAAGPYSSSGADYAELFEWEDGNPNDEDRVGRFVTLDGENIRFANKDDFVLGIISGNPSVAGDVHDDQWQGMFLYDIYGRPIYEDVEVPDETIEIPDPENPEQTITQTIIPAHTETRQKINPDYDNSQTYIPRTERKEWACVGMMGKLVVIDDGTCKVNEYCTPSNNGIATYSDTETKFRVMKRIDDTHIRVLIL